MNKFTLSLFCILLVSLLSSRSFGDALSDRLDSVEKTVREFQADSVIRNEKAASALVQLEQLRHDILSFQGRIDANSHTIREQQKEMMRLKRDLTERMSSIEDRLEIYDIQLSKALSKVVPAAVNETDSYQKALDLVQKSDFLTAVASFRGFLKKYPSSELADNAQYWIAECYFAMRDYQKAIKEFQVLVEKYPRSDKIKSAILKQGLSFAELQMPDEAKIFLEKTVKDYPGTDEAARAKEKLDKLNQKTESIQTIPLTSPEGDAHANIPLAPGVKNQPKKPAEENEKPVRSKD